MTAALEARVEFRVEREASHFELQVELELTKGVLVLYGPSGAGKTIALRALAGLVRPDDGYVRIAGVEVFDRTRGLDTPPHRRGVGYVPQHDALFPFTDVLGNVGFGVPRRRRDEVALPLLEELELADLASAAPESLSGGERRRVALARALAVEPRLLLLDEPFTGIDTAGRTRLTTVLRRTLATRDLPAVLVTHDVETARTLGDHVVVLDRGRIVAAGDPATLLESSVIGG